MVSSNKYQSAVYITFTEEFLFSKIRIFVPLKKSKNYYNRYKNLCIETNDDRGLVKEYCWQNNDQIAIVNAASKDAKYSNDDGILELGPLKTDPDGVSIAAKRLTILFGMNPGGSAKKGAITDVKINYSAKGSNCK